MQRSRLIYGLVGVPLVAASAAAGIWFGLFNDQPSNENPYASVRIERKAYLCFNEDNPRKKAEKLLPGKDITQVIPLGCTEMCIHGSMAFCMEWKLVETIIYYLQILGIQSSN